MAEDARQPSPKSLPPDQLKPGRIPPGERSSAPSWASWHSPSTQPVEQNVQDRTVKAPKEVATTTRSKQEPVNIMPGGTVNTAGGEKVQDYSFWNVLTSIRPNEFSNFHKLPCVRDSLLTGIALGFVGGGAAVFMARTVWQSCNFAVGSFLCSSAGMHEYCRYQRRREREGIMKAVEVMDARRIAKEKNVEEARERTRRERREVEERARLEEETKRRRSWKFW